LEHLLQLVEGLPAWLATFLLAMLPLAELRGAIPVALVFYANSLTWYEIYIISVIGNMVPILPLLFFWKFASDNLRKIKVCDRFLTWLFNRTRRRASVVEKYEAIGLTLFVAIPLPVTGAWTGSVAAFLFGIRRRWAMLCITIGVMIAGAVVTLAVKLGFAAWFLIKPPQEEAEIIEVTASLAVSTFKSVIALL